MTHKPYQPEKKAGIWIDHQHAVLIEISPDHSPVFKEIELTNESPSNHNKQVTFNHQDRQQRHDHQHALAFYKEILSWLRAHDYVYLFGPGSAKLELNRSIEKEGKHFPCKVAAIDPCDKLTRNQLKEKVIGFFTSLRYEDIVRETIVHH